MKAEHREEKGLKSVGEGEEEEKRDKRLWITATATSLFVVGLVLAYRQGFRGGFPWVSVGHSCSATTLGCFQTS